jgi:hypothetical protein
MYICPNTKGFQDTVISLYSSKIVDKKEILRTVSNSGIYCSSDKDGTVYLVQFLFLWRYSPNLGLGLPP